MALARHGVRPYRSVRFVLYTGEEAGLFGSWAEVVSHRATLDQVKGQIIFDAGAGRTTGFSLGGREDLRAAVEAALAPARALGPFTHTADAFLGTDNYDYMVEGVPTFVANQDPEPYLPDYHAETDAYDRADLRELRANSAIAAALAWGLAEMPKGPGPRQTHAEVEALTHATGLDAQMRAFDLWDDFVSGARGRRP
jgi:Zn-dependent M28 family amino/carboxypeptidase